MNFRTIPLPRFVVLTAAFGLLTGCPGKEGDPTGNDDSTGTTTPTSVSEDTATTGPTTEMDTGSTNEMVTTAADTTVDPTTGDTTIDPSMGDTTIDTSTGEPDPVCECISIADFGDASFTCGSGACGLIAPDCVEGGGDTDTDTDTDTGGFGDCEIEVDETQIDCALDLLISGEPGGVVKWVYSADQGFSTDGGFVQVLPERQGLTRTWYFVDLGGEDSAAGVVSLRPADYFQGCKDLPTGAQRFGCMVDWSEEEPAAQCDEPGYQSDI